MVNRRDFLGLSLAFAGMPCLAKICDERRWYKGMVHCHSLWSDGRAFPEQVVDWYRSRGYNFLSISDHNQFQDNPDLWAVESDKKKDWRAEKAKGLRSVKKDIVERYLAKFPDAHVRTDEKGRRQCRLRTFDELARRFDVPGSFALLPGTELTHRTKLPDGIGYNVHMNLVNVPGVPAPYRAKGFKAEYAGKAVPDIVAEKIREATAFAAEQKRRHLLVMNHPIWIWYDISPETLVAHPEVRFFEVCNNGSPDAPWPELPQDGLDTDRFWDVVNAFRARRGQPLLYGVGNDDTHYYFGEDKPMLMPGNAWSRVRARSLAADDLIEAMERGDFLACEGLEAEDVSFDRAQGELRVSVAAAPGEVRKITFIVSKRDFDERPVRTLELSPAKPERRRRVNVYDDRIGKVVRTVVGKPGERLDASYRLAPDDLYVRARVESPRIPLCKAALHPKNACCWTQPYSA